MAPTVSLRRHAKARALGARGRALIGVGLGIALLVGLNGLVRENYVPGGVGQFVGSPPLPVVQMSRPSAWRCPGPLPVGAGKESSSIAIVNGSGANVSVAVSISRTSLPVGGTSKTKSVSGSRVQVDGHSQAVLALPRTGPAGFAAVSVETDGGGIGVAESISGLPSLGGAIVVSSPCALGSAPRAYIAAGSTYGSSDVRLALYDPDATPAVVDVAVSNGTSSTSPPAFQGVVIPATGLVVLDLRRWVFQVSALAVTATAVSGDIVVGALESTSATVAEASGTTGKGAQKTVHVQLTGSSLLVGPDRALEQWALPALHSRIGVSSMFSVYDPGTKSTSVSVAPPGRAGRVAALTEDVPAGGVVDFETPIAPGTHLETRSVVVSAGPGTPVVAVRLTGRQPSSALEEVNATAGTAGPRDNWLIPGATVTATIDDLVTLVVPGSQTASVKLVELPELPAVPVSFKAVTVFAGTEREIDLGPIMKDAPGFALEISSTVPILVEEQLKPRHGDTTALGAIPVSP